ncbi:hypothetical protein [Pseudomonas syringae]|uniref:Uncharacterized protein n=1 Tax=Pseudomonas syringae pv. solidagae TaxID=264458 RepID=A0A0Q0AGW6_PSESX|nr:hypothetical protein [Pseudomonas syringae]KPY62102.1 Uncharacterized protein ALO46_02201 [Pseudomonas syringae pv. solidagae]RMT37695.1 hypothetical protein ALP49_02929 [Pseudomonas syringae pv. solidagae]RMT39216.1 hypothetical protein ALP48_03717 [Pseudomonas syringae pv. solidagae]
MMSDDYKDLPGSQGPSVDDVRFEAIEFEKAVKGYIERHTGEWPKDVGLGKLIRNELHKYPMHPELPDLWPKFLQEAKELKALRNKIVHSDPSGLPTLSDLYERFHRANTLLRPFGFVGSTSRDKFCEMEWKGDHLHFKINDACYALNGPDTNNLLSELDPSSRGKVHFKKGKLVSSKMLDYGYERCTYYIEECEPFELVEEESMALQDLLICFLNDPILKYP